MVKINVLEHHRAFMARLGIHSYRLTEQSYEFFQSFGSYFIITIMMYLILTSIYMLTQNLEFDSFLDTIIVSLAGIQSLGLFCSVGLNLKKVKLLQINLQKFVDEFENGADEYNIYLNVEQKCAKYSKIPKIYIFAQNSIYILSIANVVYNVYIGNYDTSTWFIPFQCREQPFDIQSVSAWFFLLFIEFSIALTYALGVSVPIFYFIFCCLYIFAMCDHFALIMNFIQIDVQANINEKNQRKYQIRYAKCKKNFAKLVDVHNKIFE